MSASQDDHAWLTEAIRVSRLAPPVPDRYAVGAVVVDHHGRALATGYTGEGHPHFHAEEAALVKLTGQDLSRTVLYTSLEPCTTRASRPLTCTRLLLDAGIRRVVLAWREPLLFADCDGVETLRRHGVEVAELPELADQVRAVNSHVLIPAAA
ncbi:dCMP deaminase [Actinoplanes sp. G11-F43]|uniref:dCMP deaminase n=1 Tax=Actinoplanes sp. G11-F43 TaxID=3424130 RepID=UPI003D329EE3